MSTTSLIRDAVLFVSLAMLAAQSRGEETPVKLVKGLTTLSVNKPAELFFNRENGDSSSEISAALLGGTSLGDVLTRPGTVTTELTFGASISKNTGSAKPQDVRAVQASLDSVWALGGRLSLLTSLAVTGDDDRKAGAKGRTERLDGLLAGLCPARDQSPLQFKCYPYVGVYRRHVNSTDDPTGVPVGRYGGPFAGFVLRAEYGRKTEELKWYAPVAFEIVAYRLRDTYVRGAYEKKSYDFATLSFSYALYESDKSMFKPALVVSREIGTDRLANEAHVAKTRIGVQVSYGL